MNECSPPYFKLLLVCCLVLAERYDWLLGLFCSRRVKFESHTRKNSEMASGCVYWLAGHNLNEISKALEVFRNHEGWRGEIVCFSSILQSFREKAYRKGMDSQHIMFVGSELAEIPMQIKNSMSR